MATQIFHFSNTGILSGQRFYLKDDVSGIFVRDLNINSNFPIVASNLVYNTDNQTISGIKTFATGIVTPLRIGNPLDIYDAEIKLWETSSQSYQSIGSVDGGFTFTREGTEINLEFNSEEIILYKVPGIAYRFKSGYDGTVPIDANVVHVTGGNETISGIKTFATRPFVNGTGVLLSGEGGGIGTLPSTIVYTTGNQTISGIKTFITVNESFSVLSITNRTINIPLNSGMNFILPLTTGITGMTFSNTPTNVYSFTLRVDYSGAHAIVWPSGFGGILWPNNTAPTLTTTVGREDFFSFITYTSGQEFFGFTAGQNYSGTY